MSEPAKRVIVYGYNASPFYNKVLNLLAHFRVPYDTVKTGFMPPRPMLSDELNITYRRIPVMALDGQLYIDTSAIAEVLEETFGGKPGHGSKLLQRQHIIQRRITLHWFEQHLFTIAAALIPAKALSKEFVEDRLKFGAKVGQTPTEEAKATLRVQLFLLEEQLQANAKDGQGPYLLGSEPQHIDLGAYTTLNWIQTMQKSVPEYLPLDPSSSPFPAVVTYLGHIRSHIEQGRSKAQALSGQEAAKRITQSGAGAVKESEARQSNVDLDDPLVKAGRLQFGKEVDVTPMDTGRVPQRGTLVGLTTGKISIVVKAGPSVSHAPFLVHFPRAFFSVHQSRDGAKM